MINIQDPETIKKIKDVANSENGLLIKVLEIFEKDLDTNNIDLEECENVEIEYLATRKARDKINEVINLFK